MENTKYGKRREGRWTPIRAKAQDTRANPNSWETHLVRKRWGIGLLRALSPRIMMMMMMSLCVCVLVPLTVSCYYYSSSASVPSALTVFVSFSVFPSYLFLAVNVDVLIVEHGSTFNTVWTNAWRPSHWRPLPLLDASAHIGRVHPAIKHSHNSLCGLYKICIGLRNCDAGLRRWFVH